MSTLSNPTIVEGSASITVPSASVDITEIDEAVSFSIGASPASISEEAEASATFTISLTGFPLNAGNTATVDFAASGTASGGVDYTPALVAALQAVADATAGVSFDGTTLTFNSSFVGSTLAFTVTAENDDAIEGIESIVSTLSNPTIVEGSASITVPSASVDITEIDEAVSFSIGASPASISEEAEASATFTISLTGFPLNAGNTATVDFAASGTASGGVDYTPALVAALQAVADATAGVSFDGTTLTFDSSFVGSTLAFTVTAENDDAIEGIELIVSTLSNPTIVEGSASITVPSASVDITEIDEAVSFSIGASPASISEEAEASATFTISLTGFPLNAGNTATVDFAASGTASGGVDYTPALVAALQAVADATAGVSFDGTTLTFDSSFVGSTLAFTVTAENDDAIEGIESIVSTLSNPTIVEGSASITVPSASVDITEIDEAVSFSIGASPASISEEAEASATFTISLTGFPLNAGNTATVDFAASGTASGGVDYTPALVAALQAVADATAGVSFDGTTLTFDSSFVGSTLAFTVTAENDDAIEGIESIVSTLSNPTIVEGSASITVPSASVDITEIDEAVSFSIGASPASISEEAEASATFTISLTGFPLNAGNTATVDFAASGTASGGVDYTPALVAALQAVADATAGVSFDGTTLTFDSSFVGSTLAFTVTAENDDAIEGIEFDRVDAEQPDHRRGFGIDHGSVGERRHHRDRRGG